MVAGFSLGATEDSESEGQPSAGADGDGADEDGVSLPGGGAAGGLLAVSVIRHRSPIRRGIATPRLDAWIDFDGDGAFSDPRDRIATGLALVAGANNGADQRPLRRPLRGHLRPLPPQLDRRLRPRRRGAGRRGRGLRRDLAGLDFGDAPDPTYPTLLASNGARHIVLPPATRPWARRWTPRRRPAERHAHRRRRQRRTTRTASLSRPPSSRRHRRPSRSARERPAAW